MSEEETITDALKLVDMLIDHYRARYSPDKALYWVQQEIKTCVMIAEYPENDGTRFREAIKQLGKVSPVKAFKGSDFGLNSEKVKNENE